MISPYLCVMHPTIIKGHKRNIIIKRQNKLNPIYMIKFGDHCRR